MRLGPTPKALNIKARPLAAKPHHPGSNGKPSMNTLKGFYNAPVVKPRWGLKNGWLVNPGCAARPRAMMSNAFGVRTYKPKLLALTNH